VKTPKIKNGEKGKEGKRFLAGCLYVAFFVVLGVCGEDCYAYGYAYVAD